MNKDKEKLKQIQTLENMKSIAFNMFVNNSNDIVTHINTVNGILYPKYLMFTILTLDQLKNIYILHFSISIKRVKGQILSYFLNTNISIPNDELYEWAKIIYGDLGNNILNFVVEENSPIRKNSIRHLFLYFSKETKKPIEHYKKDASLKKLL